MAWTDFLEKKGLKLSPFVVLDMYCNTSYKNINGDLKRIFNSFSYIRNQCCQAGSLVWAEIFWFKSWGFLEAQLKT